MSAPPLSDGQRVIVTELGENPLEAVDRFVEIHHMPAPDPESLGDRDVIIEVRSAAVGWVDLLMTSGQYQHLARPPYTPGLEYSGVVAWAGSACQGGAVSVGDAVLVDGFLAGPRSGGAYQTYGGFARYAVAPIEAVRPVPGDLSFDQACNLLGNYETAYHCLIARGGLHAGETALILGASGATGLAAVHVAKLTGATVIAAGRSDAKLAVVKAQGADFTINTAAVEGERDLRDEIKSLTAGRGVDVVYDGVGGDVSVAALRCLRFGGRFLIVGWAATPFVSRGKGLRGAPNANHLPTNLIMMKGIDVLGCPTVISTLNDPSIRAPRLEWIDREVSAGRLRPHVSRVFPFSAVKEAMRAKWRGEIVGGCVLRPGEP